jgi:hypothetical protein
MNYSSRGKYKETQEPADDKDHCDNVKHKIKFKLN